MSKSIEVIFLERLLKELVEVRNLDLGMGVSVLTVNKLLKVDSTLFDVLILDTLLEKQGSSLVIWLASVCYHLFKNIRKLFLKIFSI